MTIKLMSYKSLYFIQFTTFISGEQNDFNKTCVRVRQNSEDSIGSDISLSPPTSPIHGPEVVEKSTVS